MTSRFKFLKTSLRSFFIKKPNIKMDELRNQVLLTFGNGIGGESFVKNLENLIRVMSKLTVDDVKLDKHLLLPPSKDDAPVTYVEILEHPRFTINMFVLRPGSQLPLHDHPNMYGVCKVVHGKVSMRNFTLESFVEKDETVKAHLDFDNVVGVTDNAVLLTPTEGNVHEMKAIGGGAAFVDVLAPPYLSNIDGLGPRPCHYFVETPNSVSDKIIRLTRVDRVPYYYTDFAPYLGD